ncbi:MAG: prolipoprotein diacylglyceryl transferase [Clostridia bacterium]|nr:prolipoprotein diacylglyceryl transferase [Clostridia bacterium]
MISSIFDIPFYLYGAAVSVAIFAWIVLSLFHARRLSKGSKSALSSSSIFEIFVFGLPSGLFLSRTMWCAANFQQYSFLRISEILLVSEGGLSMWGMLFGFLIALTAVTKKHGLRLSKTLDAVAPGMLLFIAIVRLAEVFTGQGIGKEISNPAFALPFVAIYDSYDSARYAVYRYEAVCAFLLFAICHFRLISDKRLHSYMPGDAFRFALGSYSAFQILFESMRDDDLMRYDFVRYSQVIAIAVFLVISFYSIFRFRKKLHLFRHVFWMTFLTLFACILLVYQEFQVDITSNMEINYIIMLFGSVILMVPLLYTQETNY